MAIGAARSDVARLVLRQALQPALAGVSVGIAGAVVLGAILRTLVVGADRFDAVAFAGSAVILTLVAIVATFTPLLQAVRVDPNTVLRMECRRSVASIVLDIGPAGRSRTTIHPGSCIFRRQPGAIALVGKH